METQTNQPTEEVTDRLYATPDEFAAIVGVSSNTVYSWIKLGLPSFRIGQVRRIILAKAHEWLQSGSQAPARRRGPRSQRKT